MGLTTLISGLFGLLSTLAPRLLGLIEGRAQHRREAEFLELQHRMQMERLKAEADGKLREAENVQFLEEVRATRAQVVAAIEAGSRPSGVAWIDGLNALIRPLVTLVVLAVFAAACFATLAIGLQQLRAGQFTSMADLAAGVQNSLIGFTVEAVFGYWFGSRPVAKAIDRAVV